VSTFSQVTSNKPEDTFHQLGSFRVAWVRKYSAILPIA